MCRPGPKRAELDFTVEVICGAPWAIVTVSTGNPKADFLHLIVQTQAVHTAGPRKLFRIRSISPLKVARSSCVKPTALRGAKQELIVTPPASDFRKTWQDQAPTVLLWPVFTKAASGLGAVSRLGPLHPGLAHRRLHLFSLSLRQRLHALPHPLLHSDIIAPMRCCVAGSNAIYFF